MKIKSSPFLGLFLASFLITQISFSQTSPLIAEDVEQQRQWVDSIYDAMTLKEKVGQLFMIDVFSSDPPSKIEKAKELVEQHYVGGVIFSKGGPKRQVKLHNELQELTKIPLLIGMDAEWGLAMRLDSTYAYPWNMTLGAIQDENLITEVGASIAQHSKRLGVHMNFAPVVDINTNPENPIIGNRSFGENKTNVTSKSIAFIKGMQREGVLGSAKHFPGHGDTERDSHKTLPVVDFSRDRIFREELFPYRELIAEGLSSVMVAHLNVPSLEERIEFPSSLSHEIVTGILKEELNFNGLIITDALNMKGVANFDEPGEIDLAAFLAGNDILLFSEDVPKASELIIEAYNKGLITEARLKHSVRKILYAKYKVGLDKYEPVDPVYVIEDLNSIRNEVLAHKLYENVMTVIKNDRSTLPIRDLETSKIAYVHFGEDSGNAFFEQLNRYAQVDSVSAENLNVLLDKLDAYNQVIIGYHQSSASPWSGFKLNQKEQTWLYEIARKNKVILNIFTSPYALLDLETTANFEAIQVAYQNTILGQQKAAQVIFGALEAKGKLPVSAGNNFPVGTGYRTRNLERLSYGLPEQVGMNSYKLNKIDDLIQKALDKKMTPGLQVLVARKGKVIYERNAGYHTYEKEIPVQASDVYDLASLTKILATLPLLMELVDQDEIDLETTLGEMLPSFRGSNKEQVTILEMLSHYARFKSWIPFHRMTIDKYTKRPDVKYIRSQQDRGYNVQIAEKMYVRNDIRDTVLKIIRDSELERRKTYKYSDLPFYLLKFYLEDIYGTSLEYLTQDHFYKSLGAHNTTYLPLKKFPKERIVPTENDKNWRNQLLQGYVHDEGAALLGGIGGQAGLYSTANDVAKIMQMYLNGGQYGGKIYFDQETVDKFNTCYYCEDDVRRGVGFDKPQLSDAGPTCGCVSMTSFGHSGFTGTFTWADPDEEIVYVFLANRIHPSAGNNEITRESIRSNIQELIYEAIER
ncbi:glycoside hydrolase family 3 N-terminal domain-containing protein [Salinimicrobium sediminilitoris]|uniref:glycoside hydrolase family 3 N-terminal domain-containing protein n=1 Tax=Salinimicrobium sediminilitoris TaxID=2876715 RepID=UPI001E505F63|nr:glycoside hydrolase family 3 N-terminal domain-containing protein [Salinimicrobium sediminilitoris]MCC8358696.1 serine hydrolase [Salinimicrobium sediminilitoris]